VAWLSGVRRVGKTTIARSLGEDRVRWVNCDLPQVEEIVRDTLFFFRSVTEPILVLDEVHRLEDPARLLKVGADEFPDLRILATGSSTLAATRKFSDTLTGRKRVVHLLPVLWSELSAFGVSLQDRLHRGGLPPALLASEKSPEFYREWLDSYFARDIQHLFGLRDIRRFNDLFDYLLRQSGSQFERASAASALGIARPTVESHVRALEATHAITLVPPFHGGGRNEVIRMPRLYAFDTGFISFARGWDPLRPEDLGVLWEHFVLEQLQAGFPGTAILYWRDRKGHEVDFVLRRGRDAVDAIECKWDPGRFEASSLRVFRSYYPNGRNYVVSPGAEPAYRRAWDDLIVDFVTPGAFLGDPTDRDLPAA
jgi:predicted AAA+ superfamily ATPase